MFKVFLCNRVKSIELKSFDFYRFAKSFIDSKLIGLQLCPFEDPETNSKIFWYEVCEYDNPFSDDDDFDLIYHSPYFYLNR